MASRVFPFESLGRADLVVDAVYESSHDGSIGGEPVATLLPGTGNMGGFRVSGKPNARRWIVLYTTGTEPDWPDTLDPATGQFVYHGDNRTPGHELHETARGGNRMLRDVFARLHAESDPREGIAPFLVFERAPTAAGARSVRFRGLAVPGFRGVSATEDLVAVWKSDRGERFQNYRAVFTVLDVAVVKRGWLDELASGELLGSHAPDAWTWWYRSGSYRPLVAAPIVHTRTAAEQMPRSEVGREILERVYRCFEQKPVAFEAFAARVYRLTDRRVVIDRLTRATIDGGRDAVGRYRLGPESDPVFAEFALEAKCYRPSNVGGRCTTVGVREVARLISRIRHRQFGVLVTTSVVSLQAYKEVREDGHPIVFITGGDIVDVLVENGYHSPDRASELCRAVVGET